MDLVRDLLDKPVYDRNGREMGRVDSVVLQVDEGKPPRVAAVEIGPAVLAQRIYPPLGRVVEAVEQAFGVGSDRPTRISIADLSVNDDVAARVGIEDTGAQNVERAVRKLMHLP